MITTIRTVARNTIRGMGTLPHVGSHPGWLPLIVFCMGGLGIGGIIGLLITGGATIPLFLIGSYARAQENDKYV